jgi:2-iminobutanoate/2-iminopropanoate deaminase
MREVVSTKEAPQVIGPYSQAIKANGFVFVSGQVAIDPAFAAMNEVYGKYFSSAPPARSTVEVARLPKDVLVEIDVIALA